MDATLIFQLVKLRYKLLWARTRSANGRIARFVLAYLFLILLLAALAIAGFAAGVVGAQSGKAARLPELVLGMLYVNSIFAALFVGAGINSGFSDLALRRYPLRAFERLTARHLIGILDPVWLLILSLELGLAVGLHVSRSGSFGLALAALALFFASNYVCAQAVVSWLDRVTRNKPGLGLLFVNLCAIPALAAPMALENPAVLKALAYTPSYAAAALMAGIRSGGARNMILLAVWLLVPLGTLVILDRLPAPSRSVSLSRINWNNLYDRVAALFGTPDGPLVARWLRYYLRNNRFRQMYPLAIALVGLMTMPYARLRGSGHMFLVALGAFAVVGFMGTGVVAVNPFGYEGGAFRRNFLVPVGRGAALRAASFASLLLGAALIPIAFVLWAAISRLPFDPRVFFMLFASGISGLFFFNALAIWTSLYGACQVDYSSSFGNNMSVPGNVLFLGAIFSTIAGAFLLDGVDPAVILEHWWLSIPVTLLAIGIYFASLEAGSGVFVRRRERLLHIIEGRD